VFWGCWRDDWEKESDPDDDDNNNNNKINNHRA
jgi:hypothetical protein